MLTEQPAWPAEIRRLQTELNLCNTVIESAESYLDVLDDIPDAARVTEAWAAYDIALARLQNHRRRT
jgi:hypothetical protein